MPLVIYLLGATEINPWKTNTANLTIQSQHHVICHTLTETERYLRLIDLSGTYMFQLGISRLRSINILYTDLYIMSA